jgi:hypothetical protein
MRQHNDGNDDRRWKARSRRWGKAPVAYDTNRRHWPNSEEYPKGKKMGSRVNSESLREPRHLTFEILEDSGNLPPPDVIAAEIVEDLEASLQRCNR